jgi:hypothetical protein
MSYEYMNELLILMLLYIIYYFVTQEHQQMDPTDIVAAP